MKCSTPIRRETKKALVGEALEAALKDPTSPRCGHELATDDVFCPACGARVENYSSSQGAPLSCDSDLVVPKGVVAEVCSYCKGRVSRKELWMVVILFVFLGFIRGTMGTNRYGPLT